MIRKLSLCKGLKTNKKFTKEIKYSDYLDEIRCGIKYQKIQGKRYKETRDVNSIIKLHNKMIYRLLFSGNAFTKKVSKINVRLFSV